MAAVLDSEKGYLECLNLLYKVRLLFPDFKHFCLCVCCVSFIHIFVQ